MNNKITLILSMAFLCVSFMSHADSTITIHNKSSIQLQAIWQAGGCGGVDIDWEGYAQYTVCGEIVIEPGASSDNRFGLLYSDRSVKVFSKQHGKVAYCNSMDDETITISDGDSSGVGNLKIETSC